jgi:CDP-diglyceride synthetase
MELLILPFFCLMLFLWVPGLRLTVEAMRSAQDKARAAGAIGLALLTEFLLAYCGPLVFLRHERLNMWSLLFWMTLGFIIASVVGWRMIRAFRATGKRPFLIVASSLFISAGSFPVAWFTIVAPLVKLFGIERTG